MAVNVSQQQWEELTETVRLAVLHAEQWSKEREGLANMLEEAKAALTATRADAQAADQRSKELMGLYSWGGTGGSGGPSKVEIFQDPSSYDRTPSKFEEWWMKINVWLKCHPKQFAKKNQMGFDVPELWLYMYVVLSRLKSMKGAHYAEMELQKIADGMSMHRSWPLFTIEIEGLFCPMLQQDWAWQQLKKLKQTDNMSTVAFIAEFMKLKYYLKTEDSAAVGILEDNVHPHICFQLFTTGRHSTDYNATLIAIKDIGSSLEAYRLIACSGQEAGPSHTIREMDTMDLGPGPEEDISATSWDDKKKKGKGRPPVPRGNKCFNCGQDGHGIKDCKKAKNQCRECKFHSGGHWRDCLKYIAKVRATMAEQTSVHSAPSVSKDPFAAIRGMDFEQMQAYFWDKNDLAEKLGKGKAQ